MRLNLLNKSLLFLLPVIFIMQALIIGYVTWKVRSDVIKEAEVKFTMAAKQASVESLMLLDSTFSSVSVLAHTIEGMDRRAYGSRNSVIGMFYRFLEQTPDILCCWVVFERNAFDGRDFEYINREGYGRTGRFYLSFAQKNAQVARAHDLKEIVFTEDIADIWGFNPFRQPGSFMTEPNYFSYTGIKTDSWFITTLGHPITVGGERIGVVGLDISLKDLWRTVSGIRLSQGDYPVLLSNTGVIVYHPDPSRIGRKLSEVDTSLAANRERIADIIKNGETSSFRVFDGVVLKEEAFRVFAPIKVKGINTPWSVMITVPVSSITKEADIMTRNIILVSFLGITLLAAIIALHVRRILRPVSGIYKILHNMSMFEFRLDPSLSWIEKHTGDEIADIVLMLNDIRAKLCSLIMNLSRESKLLSGSASKLSSLASGGADNIRVMMDRIKGANDISMMNSSELEESSAIAQDVSGGIAQSAQAASEAADIASDLNDNSTIVISQVKSVDEELASVRHFSSENLKEVNSISISSGSIVVFAETATDIADQVCQILFDTIDKMEMDGNIVELPFSTAGEIVKLSQHCANISKKIKSLAEELKESADSSARRIEDENVVMGRITSLSSEAMRSLDNTLLEINRVCGFIQNIAASAEEGAASSEEMSLGIDRVARSIASVAENINSISVEADKTAIAARHVAMESERLDELSLRLEKMIEKFKVDDCWEKFQEKNMHRKMSFESK